MPIPFGEHTPTIGKSCFLAPDSRIIGDVTIEPDCSVFFGAVARGDINPIRIGSRTNIQEHALLHTSTGLTPCIVGSEVTVGHRAILHGCTVEDRCIIGMGSTILDGAHIESDCIIGAHTLVTMKTRIPAGSMVMGSPGKVVRKLSVNEINSIRESAANYVRLGLEYQKIFT